LLIGFGNARLAEIGGTAVPLEHKDPDEGPKPRLKAVHETNWHHATRVSGDFGLRIGVICRQR
jgi:hypothetical protein